MDWNEVFATPEEAITFIERFEPRQYAKDLIVLSQFEALRFKDRNHIKPIYINHTTWSRFMSHVSYKEYCPNDPERKSAAMKISDVFLSVSDPAMDRKKCLFTHALREMLCDDDVELEDVLSFHFIRSETEEEGKRWTVGCCVERDGSPK